MSSDGESTGCSSLRLVHHMNPKPQVHTGDIRGFPSFWDSCSPNRLWSPKVFSPAHILLGSTNNFQNNSNKLNNLYWWLFLENDRPQNPQKSKSPRHRLAVQQPIHTHIPLLLCKLESRHVFLNSAKQVRWLWRLREVCISKISNHRLEKQCIGISISNLNWDLKKL